VQMEKKELLDSEWVDLLLEALDMNITSTEVSEFLKHESQ